MSNVRQLVTKHVEEEVLIQALGSDYPTATQEQKNRIISTARDLIDQNVERILNTFVQDIQRDSPDTKRSKRYNVFAAVMSLVASTGLAHAVNLENVAYASVCGVFLLSIQIYSIFKGF
ncbi:hypothetical protein AB0R65_14470 [Bacillus velezensis]|uniref:hypothetical protein n=1 Tax=Bacillus velezensis TaxID=492670 RepID=UPI003456F65F